MHHIFLPYAQNGDLGKVLSSERLPRWLNSDLLLCKALVEFSSALSSVHDYVKGDLKLVGYHFDLRPANILVNGNKLILADFGQSRFRPEGDRSKFLYNGALFAYAPPESIDPNTFKRREVGQPVDIWCLGCIISELLTHRLKGGYGLERYKQSRRVDEDGFLSFRFHGQAKPGVEKWLDELKPELSPPGRKLLELAKDMMAEDPSKRPTAAEVHERLITIVNEDENSWPCGTMGFYDTYRSKPFFYSKLN
jgi:serine/threonine protein kinase